MFFYEIKETMNTVVVLRVGYNRRNWKEILLYGNGLTSVNDIKILFAGVIFIKQNMF